MAAKNTGNARENYTNRGVLLNYVSAERGTSGTISFL